jgi:hypothetical protein
VRRYLVDRKFSEQNNTSAKLIRLQETGRPP